MIVREPDDDLPLDGTASLHFWFLVLTSILTELPNDCSTYYGKSRLFLSDPFFFCQTRQVRNLRRRRNIPQGWFPRDSSSSSSVGRPTGSRMEPPAVVLSSFRSAMFVRYEKSLFHFSFITGNFCDWGEAELSVVLERFSLICYQIPIQHFVGIPIFIVYDKTIRGNK